MEKEEKELKIATHAAIKLFNDVIRSYSTFKEYSKCVNLTCASDDNGEFDVIINGIRFFRMGPPTYGEIHAITYCTICVMREFYVKNIQTAGK